MKHNLRHRSSNKAWELYGTGPAEQFSKCGGRSTSFDVKLWGVGGGGVDGIVDFKNSLPGADSIFFDTVTTL